MLNPTLYKLLRDRFRDVKICNEGENQCSKYACDPRSNKMVLDIESRGETYCIDCPFCNDSRQRLYINHRYGVYDSVLGSYNSHLVKCFNEECFQKEPSLYHDLYLDVYGMLNPGERKSIVYSQGVAPVAVASVLTEGPPPGSLTHIQDLPENHVAVRYLESRGYDITELAQRWHLTYCEQASPKYRLAENRIVIPIIQNNIWVGWQARYVGDVDFKATRIPKYYTLPSLPKRLLLYNYDTAIKQDMIVICEGPTSAWSMWPHGVALFGKQATIQQQRLIAQNFTNKTIVVLLDGDAIADTERLYTQLSPYVKTIVKVKLPSDRDPGSYHNSRSEIWNLIKEQAEGQRITLPVPNLEAANASKEESIKAVNGPVELVR